jgi:hypothetical protein
MRFLEADLGAFSLRPSGLVFVLIVIPFAVKLFRFFVSFVSLPVRLFCSLAALASLR